MPRDAHLDPPGTLDPVMVQVIERTKLFRVAPDRADFIARVASLFLASLLACTIFPAGILSRQECEHRERQWIQHPEVRPHVEAPPISQSCAEARAGMRWSEMPCGPEGAKKEKGKKTALSGRTR